MFTFMHEKSIIKAKNDEFQDLINAPRIFIFDEMNLGL